MTMSSGHPGRQRALIVEDEILIALALEAEVKDLGFNVCGLAANATQAIAMALEGEPDIAVMDIYLNGARDGIETARMLRDLCGVQVVFVTAYSADGACRTHPATSAESIRSSGGHQAVH
jgi:DNA-binding NarL/FixJ family response regulator